MSRRDDFTGVHLNCLMCENTIPPERPRNAVTCSKECTIARKKFLLSRLDTKMCRYCSRPSTPEQRALYQQWKRRPQDAEEEEQFRLWREDQIRAQATETRRANMRAKKTEVVDGDVQRVGEEASQDAAE